MAEIKGELVTTAKIPAQVGKSTVSDEKAWVKQQIIYPNYAGHSELLDGVVLQLVRGCCNSYRGRMTGVMRRWALNYQAHNGNVPWLRKQDEIHFFETQKASNGKCARVEEAILEFNPPFETEGDQSEVDMAEAKVLQEWVLRKAENANWQDLIQPCALSNELANLAVIKVTYERRPEMVVDRKTEFDNEKAEWTDERRLSDAIGRRGVRYDQVSPFWFFRDLQGKDAQDGAYAGDESEPFLHEVQRDAKQGLLSETQVAKVIKARQSPNAQGTGSHEWVDAHRRAQSVALGQEFASPAGDANSVQHEATRCRQIECWHLFDFGDGIEGVVDPVGRPLKGVHEMVSTIVDNIVVRFQQNPNDTKCRPYAMSVVRKNGAGSVAPAPFDATTQMNAHYDHFVSGVRRWQDLSIAPIGATTDPNSQFLSKPMTEVKAGTVLRNQGALEWQRIPDITQTVAFLQGMYRREMEETSGNLRVFEGSPDRTATETNRKVQEQQRAIRSSIRANSDLWEQVWLITQAMEAQYSNGPDRFAVVGKEAGALDSVLEITPDTMLKQVRFRMLAMKNLHVLGNRIEGMGQWATYWGAMLPNTPEVKLTSLMRDHLELLVGRSVASRAFPKRSLPWDTMPQEQENTALLAGHRIHVSDADDDLDHMRKMLPMLSRKDLPEYVRGKLMEHWLEHQGAYERKQAEQQAMLEEAQQRGQLMAPSGGTPGQDRAAAPGGLSAQNQPGVTPGPEQGRAHARTGRSQSPAQQTMQMAS